MRDDLINIRNFRQLWWHTPVIPALRELKQENYELKSILGYILLRKALSQKGVGLNGEIAI